MREDDKRLIEDYLPIEAISAEASREKSVRKGHISTLHLWWARRPLVACRAAVYGALVPASQFIPNGAQTDEKKKSLGRANAAKFVKGLCQYPGSPHFIGEAQHHILNVHADRLTREIAGWKAGKTAKPAWIEEFKFSGERVSVEDITAGRAPRPRVLDMFAGGGAIPLEALRLGCEAHALDLNPVAYIIELCTLVYPQRYGRPDLDARGVTGPKNTKGETSWGGLAEEVRYWGEWVLRKVKAEIGDLYPLIPDPEFKGKRPQIQPNWFKEHDEVPPGYLIPVAYLWTRTVQCKNPACKATVPLVRQTWLCKKPGRFVAMKMVAPKGEKKVRFEVVEAISESKLGFDPEGFSKGGNATCPFCGTVADTGYSRQEGIAGRMCQQAMGVLCLRPDAEGKVYLAAKDVADAFMQKDEVLRRIEKVSKSSGLSIPTERIEANPRSMDVHLFGLNKWGDVFTDRQNLSLLAFAAAIREAEAEMQSLNLDDDHRKAIALFLACNLDKQADRNSQLCVILADGGRRIKNTFARQALPMTWDFAEANPFNKTIASWPSCFKEVLGNIRDLTLPLLPGIVSRGSALSLSWGEATFDAIVTDPPYYDNVSYSNLSDFFYVWLKRAIGHLFPEHFASEATPKRSEAIAATYRHNGSKELARRTYEDMMAKAFREAHRVLKPSAELVVVYAHKTTLGWATLVDALRTAKFTVTEAWPLDTETKGRLIAQGTASLASSIFLIARKRDESPKPSNYEEQVRPELDEIVRERVETLWEMGVSGADLVIACVGAGLRAFTRFARVEYANGEEVPAERFLTEVETVVLDTVLQKLSKAIGGNGSRSRSLAGLDPATRFYVLWRYTYGAAELDAGEAIIFANGTHVELDGPLGLSAGSRALVEKKKGKYKLRDFAERGDDDDLGVADEGTGESSAAIDVLHRLLWLLEKRPPLIPEFVADAQPNLDQLRLVAQALAGPALKGGELENVSPTAEQSALGKLLANWSTVMEGKAAMEDRRVGQQSLGI